MVDACLAVVATPDLTIEELIAIVPGPDFPTAGIIRGTAGIVEAYTTGRGIVQMQARARIEHAEQGQAHRRSSSTSCPTR